MINFILKPVLFLRFLIASVFVISSVLISFVGLFLTLVLPRSFMSYETAIQIGSFWARFFSHVSLWAFSIKVRIEGAENLKKQESGRILLFKHLSYLDIPILMGCLPVHFRFGAKKQVFSIPFFGSCMKAVNTLVIDRGDREKVLRLYRKSVPHIERGLNYALAPEGTRRNGLNLGRFGRGPFYFGIEAQADLVPILLYGAYEAYPPSDWLPCMRSWSYEVCIQVLEPISTQGMKIDDTDKLREMTRKTMLKAYKIPQAEDKA